MKNLSFIIISFVLCLVFTDQAHAQRYLPGQKGYGLKIEHRDIGKDALRGK